jgi:hypothetical protein
MNVVKWLSTLFNPSEFSNLNIDELGGALRDSDVRRHWMVSVLNEIKEINLRTHVALMNGNLTERFAQESARLQGIDWTLRQILNSKTSVAMERHHNQADDVLNGVAVHPAP